jgi:hypothetical protein
MRPHACSATLSSIFFTLISILFPTSWKPHCVPVVISTNMGSSYAPIAEREFPPDEEPSPVERLHPTEDSNSDERLHPYENDNPDGSLHLRENSHSEERLHPHNGSNIDERLHPAEDSDPVEELHPGGGANPSENPHPDGGSNLDERLQLTSGCNADEESHFYVGHQNQGTDQTLHSSPIAVKEWRTWRLRWWWMTLLIVVEMSFIITLITLERVSATRNGIASVPQIPTASILQFSISTIWQYGFLWTTLPSLIMSVYRLMWESVANGSAERQPYIELLKPREAAASAKTTIMLDYRSYPAIRSWFEAFRNRHNLLGCAMLLSLTISFAVVPLTAHLFVTAPAESNSTITLVINTAFNDSALTPASSFKPAIDLATATQVYKSDPPSWMTTEYAFEPLDTKDVVSGNITAKVDGYSAYLNCQIIPDSSYQITYSPSSDEGVGTNSLKFTDQGCQVEQIVAVSNLTLVYAMSWYSACQGSEYNRIGVITGQYSGSSATKLADVSVISCIPSYWRTTGSLTLSFQSGASPKFVAFQTGNSTSIRPLVYYRIESTLHAYKVFDPSSKFNSDAFGLAVYSFANMQNPNSPLDQAAIKNSTEDMFTTFYAALANTMLFTPSNTKPVTGVVSKSKTRLFVVNPVAYTIVVILVLALVCNIFLFVYAERNRSILKEESVGLLGNAALTHGSGVEEFVSNFRRRHPSGSNVTEHVKKAYSVRASRCFVDELDIIRVEDLEEMKNL